MRVGVRFLRMVAGSKPARGASFRYNINRLLTPPDATHDIVRASSATVHPRVEPEALASINVMRSMAPSRHEGGAKSTQFKSSFLVPDPRGADSNARHPGRSFPPGPLDSSGRHSR